MSRARSGALVVVAFGMALVASAERTTYLDRYFEVYPTRATAEGRHDLDHQLENLDEESRRLWVGFNSGVAKGIERQLADPGLDPEIRLDQELVLRHAQQTLFEHQVLRRPERNPLWWTGKMSSATVFLLVREDLPLAERLGSAAARAGQMGRLASQAMEALGATDPTEISPELCRIAARQARNSALFYREGFAGAASGDEELAERMKLAGLEAAEALATLAEFLEELAGRATGSPRLGEDYAELFRLFTGDERPVEEVLAAAEADLEAKRREVAEYGRSVWAEIFPWAEQPADDLELIRALFDRVEQDRCTSAEEMVEEYRRLILMAEEFARVNEIITLPDPLTVVTDNSPSFFVGQSVGGVYPAGPYAPDADTLLFLPTPSPEATPEQKDALFRAFNHHFNVMITPHEIVPGHYLQLKYAARHPSKVRAIFGDGVYIEGWGTFVERLMLDQGWGNSLARLAHLKKQLENIARTIVDIRVHTTNVSREEILAFVRDEALQDEQFAGNMWMRSITSAPQLTSYYLGYRQVWDLYQDVKAARGEAFVLREFMDGMMEMGPVAVKHYRAGFLPEPRPR